MHRVIGERDLEETSFSDEEALALYRDVVRTRRFDERALALQRRGWMSGYPPYKGQEGSQVGAAHALSPDDWVFPTYRSNALQIAFGVPMSDILLFRRGHAEYHSDHGLNVFPQAVPIATQIPHAAGVGMATNYCGENHAVFCYFGDGATSEGDFHEGLNFAGVFDAPVVFFCENNDWAISLPRERQTASDTIAEKANAYGFKGGQVDGNDPIAVREMVSRALEHAREGSPILVESLTYRQGAHTTSDDPSRYRDDRDDLPDWRTADPLERYETYLLEQGVLDERLCETIADDADTEIAEAIGRAEAVPDPELDEVFDHVYADRTPRLDAQQARIEGLEEKRDVQELEH